MEMGAIIGKHLDRRVVTLGMLRSQTAQVAQYRNRLVEAHDVRVAVSHPGTTADAGNHLEAIGAKTEGELARTGTERPGRLDPSPLSNEQRAAVLESMSVTGDPVTVARETGIPKALVNHCFNELHRIFTVEIAAEMVREDRTEGQIGRKLGVPFRAIEAWRDWYIKNEDRISCWEEWYALHARERLRK